VLGEQQQSMARRIGLHARNAEFDAATILSQDLLDSAEPLRNEDPATYGQVMINHGVLRVAAGDYLLGLSIIKRGQEFLEASANPFDEILVNGVMAKGICVYNEEQLPVVGYLTATNLRQRNPLAADRQQLFSLRVAEQVYGPDSIEILPTLSRLGSYFATRGSSIPMLTIPELRVERDILFKRAVSMYSRAIEIIEINYGVNDLRLLPTLRGLASTRMLQVTNRRYAEFALKRSLEIVDSNPNSDLTDRAQAMVDLGDLYIITSDEKAAETYLNAWTILQETPETQLLAASLFDSPVRLYPRTSAVLYLDRAPDSTAPGEKLFVELQYDVSTDGRARGVKILDKNIPNEEVRLLRQTLRAARYRPRISNGELVETEALLLRQAFVALNNTPSPDARQEEEENAPIEEVPTEVPSAVPPIEEVPVEQTSEV
jgi:uncharacterized membrane protein